MGRTALLACPEGGTNLSAMAGLDRSSFNTEPGLRSISFSIFCVSELLRFRGGSFVFGSIMVYYVHSGMPELFQTKTFN